MDPLQQEVELLRREINERDELIHQLRVEAQGAAEAAHAARAVAARRQENPLGDTENILKALQTPQIIRDLPCFNGDPVKLHSFIRSIDNLIPLIDSARGSAIHIIWIQAIRSKIIGDADNVLELYGTALDWNEIKNNLITHYSDRRDEVSLTKDLVGIKQTGTIEEFYSKVSHIVSLLVNLLNITEENPEVKTAKNQFYQQMGLKVFLAGLHHTIGPTIRAQTPKSLKDALRACLDEGNYTQPKTVHQPPPIPSRPPQQVQSFKPVPFKFQPRPMFPVNNAYRFPQQPPPHMFRPFLPRKPQPKPERMDVDPSVRVNYMNRPRNIPPPQMQNNFAPRFSQNYRPPTNFGPQNFAQQNFARPYNPPKFHFEELTNTEQCYNNFYPYEDFTENYYQPSPHYPDLENYYQPNEATESETQVLPETANEVYNEKQEDNDKPDDLNFQIATSSQTTT